MTLDLPWHQHINLAGHNLRAAFGIGGRRRVGLRRQGAHYVVRADGGEVHVPSALRWRFYRYGLAVRLDRLARQFALDRLERPIGPGSALVDIGANVGEFGMIAAARGATCLCIEADPAVMPCLAANTAPLDGVTAVNTLLWHEAADLSFWSEPRHADSSVFRPSKDPDARKVTLPARPLDAVMAEHAPDGPIDLIKCDAEGAEPEVLRGASDTLARTRAIAVDTGAERAGETTSDAVTAILAEHGFAVETLRLAQRTITFGHRSGELHA